MGEYPKLSMSTHCVIRCVQLRFSIRAAAILTQTQCLLRHPTTETTLRGHPFRRPADYPVPPTVIKLLRASVQIICVISLMMYAPTQGRHY